MNASRSRAAQIFGERVKAARTRLGMSQETIAHLADMHVTNYGRVERGEANSELHTIVRLATALDTDPGELLAGLYGEGMLPGKEKAFSVTDFIAARRAHEDAKKG